MDTFSFGEIFLAEAIDDAVLRNLAWVFTVLSAVVSIGLSVYRFGLSPKLRIVAILSLIVLGVTVAFLFISDLSPLKRGLDLLTGTQKEEIVDGLEDDEVNRITEYIYAVIPPDGKLVAVYNGGFFDTEINGQIVTCELIEIGDDRVLIIKGEELETIDVTSKQTENSFKVQKVPVPPSPQPS